MNPPSFKQSIVQFLASQDRNNVISGPAIQWMISLAVGGIVYFSTRWFGYAPPEDKLLIASGLVAAFLKERLSAWVAFHIQVGVKDMQRAINNAGVAEEIPVDGVPGKMTIAAQGETIAAQK